MQSNDDDFMSSQKSVPIPGEIWKYVVYDEDEDDIFAEVIQLHTVDANYNFADWITIDDKVANFSSDAMSGDTCVIYNVGGVLHIRELENFLRNLILPESLEIEKNVLR